MVHDPSIRESRLMEKIQPLWSVKNCYNSHAYDKELPKSSHNNWTPTVNISMVIFVIIYASCML